jgi:hypothetical protein
MPVYLRKSFDQCKLTLILSPYEPELSMIRSCTYRLEFKNECYSTSQSEKNNDICNNFMGRTKTKSLLKRTKEPKLYFHFWPPKKCPLVFFLTHTWWCENITASPYDFMVGFWGQTTTFKLIPICCRSIQGHNIIRCKAFSNTIHIFWLEILRNQKKNAQDGDSDTSLCLHKTSRFYSM